MKQSDYDKLLIKWVKNHYWDNLEKDKDLILRHLRTFAGDIDAVLTSAMHSDGEEPEQFNVKLKTSELPKWKSTSKF